MSANHLINNQPPREDDPCDVIAKAMRGMEISETELANHSDIPLEIIQSVLRDSPKLPDDLTADDLRKITSTLNLNPLALENLATYSPQASPPDELIQIITPFGHAGVNAYLLVLKDRAILFDTGTDPVPILAYLESHNLALDTVYITHGHHDHTAGLGAFPNTPVLTPENLPAGTPTHLADGIDITMLETDGHFTPSRAYFITGLSQPLCICGDIIFAGSMGKTANNQLYKQSLLHARQNLMTLPPETILCTGHGPLTTVRQEAEHNPFLA